MGPPRDGSCPCSPRPRAPVRGPPSRVDCREPIRSPLCDRPSASIRPSPVPGGLMPDQLAPRRRPLFLAAAAAALLVLLLFLLRGCTPAERGPPVGAKDEKEYLI